MIRSDPSAIRPSRGQGAGLPHRPSKEPHWSLLALGEALALVALLALAVAIRTHPAMEPLWRAFGFTEFPAFMHWRQTYTALLVFQVLALPPTFWALRQYAVNAERTPLKVWLHAAGVVLAVQFVFIALLYILKAVTVPHGVAVANLVLLLVVLPTWRAVWNHRTRRRMARGQGLRNVLLVGADRAAQDLAAEIARNSMHGRRIVGFLADDREFSLPHVPPDVLSRHDVWTPPVVARAVPTDETRHVNGHGSVSGQHGASSSAGGAAVTAAPVLQVSPHVMLKSVVVENTRRQPRHLLAPVGTTAATDVALALDGLFVEEVFVSAAVGTETMARVVRACRDRGVDLHIIPQHFPELGATPAPWTLGHQTVMGLYTTPISRPGWAAKRAVDIVGGLVGLLAFSPVIVLACLAIKLENWRAPLFYWGTRVGLKGRHFKICKLTTMVPDADEKREQLMALNARAGPWFQIDSDKDPRITRVGHALRKYTINELPQFWNVVRGDMSLVGPRPLATDEVSRFVDYDFRYYRSFDVKPGMTGLWQVYARKNPSFETRIEMDFEYIDKWSFWLDLKLMLLTPLALVKSPGR